MPQSGSRRYWSTLSARRGNETRYWQKAHVEAFFEMDVAVERSDGFVASIDQQACGPIGLSKLKVNSPQRLVRSKSAIARCDRLRFEFIMMRDGDTLLCQNGKEVIVKAGESVLVDNRVPYSLATSAASRNLVYHIPFDWMNLWAATTDDFSARVIGPSVPWGNVVKVMGTELASAIGDVNYGRAHLYAEQLASAIALSLTEGRAQQDITSASAIYRRAMDAMRSHSHVTGFGAQALATHLGISARYICKIFAFQGTTFGGELLAIRLERARSMLGNANLASVTIAEVGWRAGFSDPSHFSRVFREKYGKPPGAFRDARKIARHDA